MALSFDNDCYTRACRCQLALEGCGAAAYWLDMLTVAALYKFVPLEPEPLRGSLLSLCRACGVRGSLLLAPEGVNGTIAGPEAGIATVLAHIRGWPRCGDLDWKRSETFEQPFGRMKVRLKREIVTMGRLVDPRRSVGRCVAPGEWNTLISAPDVAVIDTRNAYEVAVGSFSGAIDPGTARFGDFPAWWDANRARLAGKRIAMFCTGGIRCEKATAYLCEQGVEEVHHLKGGILNYLEEVPSAQSLWRGECFVFDGRVTVGHGLAPGTAILCHACRRPLRPQDREHPAFEAGVACHLCADEFTGADRARFRERQRQIALAAERRDHHLGPRGD